MMRAPILAPLPAVIAARVAALRAEHHAIATAVADGYRAGEISPFLEEVLVTREHQIATELRRLGAEAPS